MKDGAPIVYGSSAFEVVIEFLWKSGLLPDDEIVYQTAELSLLVAEACNLAAKRFDESLYFLKPRLVAEALDAGCAGGWGIDGAFHLYYPDAGACSFHDPGGDLEYLVGRDLRWPHPWCGLIRQHAAFDLLRARILGDYRALRRWAYATRPGKRWSAARKWILDRLLPGAEVAV